jgi:hypothetical protein
MVSERRVETVLAVERSALQTGQPLWVRPDCQGALAAAFVIA